MSTFDCNSAPACCAPQTLSIDNSTGYLTISDGNSIFLGTVIDNLGIKTPVIDFFLNGTELNLVYTDDSGAIQTKIVDLSSLIEGGSFTVQNTATINPNYLAGVLSADVNVSATLLNAIQIRSDGLFVPTFIQTPITATNTSTLQLLATGLNGTNLAGNVLISSSLGNTIQILGDGLFVPNNADTIIGGSGITVIQSGNTVTISANPTSQVPISVNDSSTIHFNSSGSFGTTITANVKVSAAANNAVVVNSDGIYVPASSVTQFTCANARLCFAVTAPLTYDSSTGVFGITQATTASDGFLSQTDYNTFNNKIGSGTSLGTGIPVFAGQVGTVLTFNSLVAGPNVTITSAAGNITISAVVPPPQQTFVLDFIVGDGGAFTPVNGATTFSPTGNPLAGKTILGFWIEGIKVAAVPRGGINVSFTFTQSTGAVVLTNATFTTGSSYSFIYT